MFKKINFYLKDYSKWPNKSARMLRRYRGSVGFILVFAFIVAAIFFRDWNGWSQLAQIGTFFLAIGIIITAWQFVFQETQDKKEQLTHAIKIADEIVSLEKDLIEFEYNNKPDKILHTKKVKDAVMLFNKIDIFLRHRIVDLEELYILAGNNFLKVFVASIKSCLKYYGTPIGLEANISDDFIIKYRTALVDIYNEISFFDKNISIFKEEVMKLKELQPRQENLSVFISKNLADR